LGIKKTAVLIRIVASFLLTEIESCVFSVIYCPWAGNQIYWTAINLHNEYHCTNGVTLQVIVTVKGKHISIARVCDFVFRGVHILKHRKEQG